METAAHPSFHRNILHESLYRKHVLGEECSVPKVSLPYYDESFYSTIRELREENHDIDLAVISFKQLYKLLLDKLVLCSPATDDSPLSLSGSSQPTQGETGH